MHDHLRLIWRWLACSREPVILDRHTRLRPFEPNAVQRRLYAQWLRQAAAGVPVRSIVLKARKVGISTLVQLTMLGLARYAVRGFSGRTIAHTEDSTQDIHEIVRRACRALDGQPPRTEDGNPVRVPAMESTITTRTAGGRHVLSGATTTFAHVSELAKWPGSTDDVRAQLASILQSVPHVPESVVVIESTANMLDESGEFQQRWEAAVEAQRKAEPGAAPQPGSWLPFFSPWFEDPDCTIPDVQPETMPPPDPYEQWLIERFGLTPGQIAWRRAKIQGDFAGQTIWFAQEYPATPAEAFQRPSGLVFTMLSEQRHLLPTAAFLDRRTRTPDAYRSIDFGATDPFVCLWVWHDPGAPPALTIDPQTCPNTWRELRGYRWAANGRPADKDDHTVDALRYAVTHWSLTGHVHVADEIYEPDTAARGLTVLDMANLIEDRQRAAVHGRARLIGTVADRSQPGTIQLLCDSGLVTEPHRPEAAAVARRSEKMDGIMRMAALLAATRPLRAQRRGQVEEHDEQALLEELRQANGIFLDYVGTPRRGSGSPPRTAIEALHW